jgi:hypothetical protein
MEAAFRRLIDANARLWAGEAAVVRSYFESPRRTRASDLHWIARQAFKEMWDGVLPQLERLRRDLTPPPASATMPELVAAADSLHAELRHYAIFTALHEALREADDAPLDPALLERTGDWPENRVLRELRAEHVRVHGALGDRAQRFTEGGYATLFAEGRRLRGRSRADDRIAEACERVYGDEIGHMREGVAGLDAGDLGAEALCLLTELSTAQMRARIRMRNAQFGYPAAPQRIAELCAGALPPLEWTAEADRRETPIRAKSSFA